MKGFVGDVWKIAAAFASGAFLLSLVTGLVAANPLGVVVLRAFLLAALFACFGAGLRFVIKRYLPELLGSTASDGVGSAETATGGAERSSGSRGAAVDIVLQDDESLRRQAYGGSGGGRSRGSTGETTDDEGEESLAASLDGDFMSQGDTAGLPELAEELAEELPPAGESTGTSGAAAVDAEGDPAEETEPMDELPRGMRGASGGTDSLPDIDGLEAPEEKPSRPPSQNPRSTAARPLRSAEAGKPGDAMRDALSGQDPTTLARAIRTVLKNAEKG